MDILLKYFPHLRDKQIDQFGLLGKLYPEWNQKINIISRLDIGSLYEKHILHSLSIAKTFEFKPGTRIIDMGTGGGFPGIPLAIYFPETKFHLVDSIGKKLKVVQAIAESTGLKNVTIQKLRLGEKKNEITGFYDFAVSRAVAPLKDLYRWIKPYLRKDGIEDAAPALISLKGGDLKQEIRESGLDPKIIDIHKLFDEDYFREKYMLICG